MRSKLRLVALARATRMLGHKDAQTRMFQWTREKERFVLNSWN